MRPIAPACPPSRRRALWLFALCAFSVTVCFAIVPSGFSQVLSQYLSPGDQHKVRVTDPAVLGRVQAAGGRMIANYGGYQVFEVDATAVQTLRAQPGLEVRDDYNVILLNAGPIDTTTLPPTQQAATIGKSLRLVQFAGPIQPAWRNALAQAGLRVVSYIPNNAYLVYGDDAGMSQFQAAAGTNAPVQWQNAYTSELKMPAKTWGLVSGGLTATAPTDLWAIQLVNDPANNGGTLQLIDLLKLEPIFKQGRVLEYQNIIVRISPTRILEVAARPDVVSVLPYNKPQLLDERQDQIVSANLTGDQPSGPGYLAWLTGHGFSQAQFTTSGFAVDVSDSGIDNGTTTPFHFGLYANGDTNAASRVIYNRLEGIPNPGSTLKGCDGHGTLNTHIIGGFNDRPNGFPHTDNAGFHYGLGVCPFVNVGSSVIFDPSSFTFPDFSDLQSRAYHSGARISNNSWGETFSQGAYDVDAQQYDSLVRDAQPTGTVFVTTGNQQMVIVFANGNEGPDSQSVGSPATAKNVISVGAAENVQPFGGCDGSGICDDGADSANDIIFFSSRGPCADGRTKPDLVAPGTHVSGGVIQAASPGTNGTADACFDGSGVSGGVNGDIFFPSGQQFYTASSGTSHAAPAVAGACALVRQYFLNQSLTAPSPAMTKAFLMNSTRYLTGDGANDTLWSDSQGMGELDLDRAFDGVARILRDQDPADKFTASGQTRTFTGTISDSSKPFRVTLAWTDAPGSTSGKSLNNDLDLVVVAGGNVYNGNVFFGANSITGGNADTLNNVESVFLPAGVTGNFSVIVKASNINSDGVPNDADPLDQDFALVVYNGTAGAVPVVGVSSVLVDDSGGDANGLLDPGECANLQILLKNYGTIDLTGLSAGLSTTTADVTVPQTVSAYPDLPANATITNNTVFQVCVDSNLVCGTQVDLSLVLTTSVANLDIPISLDTCPENQRRSTLTLTSSGGGIVFSSPSGISCGGDCSESYINGTVVTLTPMPGPAGTFAGWSGDCSGTLPCTLTMDSDKSVSAAFTFPLQINKGGSGAGSVSGTGGLFCSGSCSRSFTNGTVVTLTATPDATSAFTGWSGPCTGTAPCSVTMDSAVTVGATFTRNPVVLTVTRNGAGSVVSSTPGIDCGANCSGSFNAGSVVTLTATPVFGGTFLGWGGACSGTGPCVVTNTSAQNVTATFAVPVRVLKAGSGSGTVTSAPLGIDCGANCQSNFVGGTALSFTATPDPGSIFSGWSGACSGTGPCTVTNNTALSVTATFDAAADLAIVKTAATNAGSTQITYNLTVTNNGPSAATGVTVLDVLPSHATVQSATASVGSFSRGIGQVTFNIGTLSSGAVATAQIVVTPATGGQVCNTATVSANELDPNPSNNRSTACVAVTLPAPESVTPHDMAVTALKAPKRIKLSASTTNSTAMVMVTIQNRSPHAETIEDTAMLADLVHLTVNSLGHCPNPAPVLVTKIASPVTLRPKASLNVLFSVKIGCANDGAQAQPGAALHNDYSYTASVDHAALDGQADTHPDDDICPRSVPAPGVVDPNPDGTILDKGCGGRKPNGTFGAPVYTDVVVK